jgi:hypothetical protein
MEQIPVSERRRMADLHFENDMWLNAIKFYNDELVIFENRLAEVSSRNSSVEVKAQIERFQNQFIRERDILVQLRHDIKSSENELIQYAKDKPVAVDHVYFRNHTGLEDRMNTFVTIWKELRSDYMRFLKEWM